MRNVTSRGVSQGGSTLTQQLAKNLFLTQERTLSRKVQEAILSVWLEKKFSKNQILELYLNRVYFGSGAYGVEAAAQRYFGKPAIPTPPRRVPSWCSPPWRARASSPTGPPRQPS
jgi:penicillin-binding protein 1A